MNILILGGTGAMGEALLPLLAEEDHRIVVTSRSVREKRFKNVNYVCGDAHEGKFLEELLLEKWDVIIDFMIYTTEQFACCIDRILAGTKHYLFFSSARVYAESKTLIHENSDRLLDVCKDEEYLQTDDYALCKARQEDILKSKEKKNWTIIRPYITYNTYRLQLGNLEKENWLYRAVIGKSIFFSKDMLDKYTTMTYACDVARILMKIICDKENQGETYNITGTMACRWRDILEVYIDVLKERGLKPRIVYVDRMTEICKEAKYQIEYDRLYNRRFDTEKMSTYLGISEFCDYREGLRKCLNDFFDNPKWRNLNRIWHKRMDLLEGIDTRDFLFPYDRIPFRSRVIIYGAGFVGKIVHQLIAKTNYCEEVLWVDKKFKELQREGLSVYNPLEMKAKEFDYVLVAVEKDEIYESIKGEIFANKLNGEAQVIGPVKRM